MTLTAKTLYAVLDDFQKKEGIWRSSIQLSYRELYAALEHAKPCFAEWDPERGLYYLDFSTTLVDLPTLDVTMLDYEGQLGSDHYRIEWATGKALNGIEFQTHAPGPLPLFPEIEEWIDQDFPERSPPLTFVAWEEYLAGLKPIS